MNNQKAASSPSQIIVLGIMAALTLAIFFQILVLKSVWFLSVLGLIFLLIGIGLFHNLMSGNSSPDKKEEPLFAQIPEKWNSHQWEELPPAIQKRMTGNMFFQSEDLRTPEGPFPWN